MPSRREERLWEASIVRKVLNNDSSSHLVSLLKRSLPLPLLLLLLMHHHSRAKKKTTTTTGE